MPQVYRSSDTDNGVALPPATVHGVLRKTDSNYEEYNKQKALSVKSDIESRFANISYNSYNVRDRVVELCFNCRNRDTHTRLEEYCKSNGHAFRLESETTVFVYVRKDVPRSAYLNDLLRALFYFLIFAVFMFVIYKIEEDKIAKAKLLPFFKK